MCSCAALYFVRSLCPYGFKATGVSLELFLSRRSVITYANMIYNRSVILRFLVSSGGGDVLNLVYRSPSSSYMDCQVHCVSCVTISLIGIHF